MLSLVGVLIYYYWYVKFLKYNKLISYLHKTEMCNGVIFKSFK